MTSNRNRRRAVRTRAAISASAFRLFTASVVGLLLLTTGAAIAADQSAPGEATTESRALVLDGKVKHPQRLSVDVLRKLPAERVEVPFQTVAWDRKVELHRRAALDAARRGRRDR